ncbi:MAG: transcription elongation factor GreA [Bacteroidetes bacterium]|nr:transcription elongation factor GreA [Bacteroidota bacterium]
MDKEFITKERKAELETELVNLESVERKEIIESLEFAKSLGDLSENAEYHQAREVQGKLEDRINEIKRILKNAEVVSHRKSDKISVGSTVVVQKKGEKEKKEFIVVGEGEADMSVGKISYQSPLGNALFDKKKGERATFKGPKGEVEYTILSVE